MSVTVYKNARIFTGSGDILENGLLAVSHAHTQFVAPERGKTPVKVAASLKDKLEYVGAAEGYAIPEDAEAVDLAGCTVLPGLIDCAARLDTLHPEADDYVDNIGTAYRTFVAYRAAAEALNCAVTTVRAMGMPNNIDIGLKNAIDKTMFFGPSILTCGPIYAVTGGCGHEKYGLVMASGSDELRRAMRIHVARGLDGVVLQVSGKPLDSLNGEYHQEMSTREIHDLIKHAHGAEKKVMTAASGDPSISACIDAGADTILEGRRIGKENLTVMAQKGISYVPCMVNTPEEFSIEHKAVVAEAIKAGVAIGVGTETLPSQPVDGTVAVVKELELLVECGMTPVQALNAATSGAAKIAGSKAGVLAAGKPADFIAVEGAPDKDIAAMRSIAMVVKSGRRAFLRAGGKNENAFRIMLPGYEVAGGATIDWTRGAVQGVIAPESYNDKWNLYKEI